MWKADLAARDTGAQVKYTDSNTVHAGSSERCCQGRPPDLVARRLRALRTVRQGLAELDIEIIYVSGR